MELNTETFNWLFWKKKEIYRNTDRRSQKLFVNDQFYFLIPIMRPNLLKNISILGLFILQGDNWGMA